MENPCDFADSSINYWMAREPIWVLVLPLGSPKKEAECEVTWDAELRDTEQFPSQKSKSNGCWWHCSTFRGSFIRCRVSSYVRFLGDKSTLCKTYSANRAGRCARTCSWNYRPAPWAREERRMAPRTEPLAAPEVAVPRPPRVSREPTALPPRSPSTRPDALRRSSKDQRHNSHLHSVPHQIGCTEYILC